MAHRTFRSWPLLVLAFGCVIFLMIASDVATIDRARRLHATVSEVNEAYHRSARSLDELRSSLHLTSLLLRDYLLDPRKERAVGYRSQMILLQETAEQHMQSLTRSMPASETRKLAQMRKELTAYWDTLEPAFAWTPQEKQAYSFAFLRHRVIPKREVVMHFTDDVETLINAALEQQRTRIAESENEFSDFLRNATLTTLIVGLGVAFASIFRVSQLERRSEQQHAQTQRAEKQMRQLSQQLVHAQEEERKAISRELHDEIGQMLTGLRMEFRGLSRLQGASPPELQSRVEQGKALLDQALQAVRDIAMGLRPSMLDDLGLEAALQWQARDFCRRHDIPVNVTVRAQLDNLPDQYKTNLYRIVQEALTNCARHAKARSIAVAIDQNDTKLTLTIRDDGVGLLPASYGKGLGLIGIEERVRELNGTMTIDSKPAKGTALTLVMPAQPVTPAYV